MADHNNEPVAEPEPGFASLFDGSPESFANWQVAGRNGFALVDGVIETRPGGDDLGLLYYAPRPFADVILRLQVRISDPADTTGVHLRCRDPRLPVPTSVLDAPESDEAFPSREAYAENAAWLAVDSGFEVQIDERGGARPEFNVLAEQDRHRTGAIYDVPPGPQPGQQAYQRGPALIPGQWADLEIAVQGHHYTVRLNGQQTTTFTNVDPWRGRSAAEDATSGYLGVQAVWFTPGHVDFRAIRLRELLPGTGEKTTPPPIVNGASPRAPPSLEPASRALNMTAWSSHSSPHRPTVGCDAVAPRPREPNNAPRLVLDHASSPDGQATGLDAHSRPLGGCPWSPQNPGSASRSSS